MIESFLYLWYDSINKMFYLGKHKGSINDGYTHSSSIWESFTKDNIPKGARRRILAYGTDEEMCILENKFLVNRKKKCWDKYYNTALGNPVYVDNSGENNYMYGKKLPKDHPFTFIGKEHHGYRHGKAVNARNDFEVLKEYKAYYYQKNREELGRKQKEYAKLNRPWRKDSSKKYAKQYRAENKEKLAALGKEYREKNKEKLAVGQKAWREKNKEKRRAYEAEYREKNKEKLAALGKAWREKNKEYAKLYYRKNLKRIKEYRADYYQKNKENFKY